MRTHTQSLMMADPSGLPSWQTLKDAFAGSGVVAGLLYLIRMMVTWYQQIRSGQASVAIAQIESEDRSEDRLYNAMRDQLRSAQVDIKELQKRFNALSRDFAALEAERNHWKSRAERYEQERDDAYERIAVLEDKLEEAL